MNPTATEDMRVQQPASGPRDASGVILHGPTPRGDSTVAVALLVDADDPSHLIDTAFVEDVNAGFAALQALEHAAQFASDHNLCVQMYVAHRQVHQWFTQQPTWHLIPQFIYGPGGAALRDTAQLLLDTHLAAMAVDVPALTIATDASARTGHPGVGIAYVTEDGHARQAYLSELTSVTAGELEAIKMALEHQGAPKIVILTDSLDAAQWINGECEPSDSRDMRRVRHIGDLSAHRDVTVSWVRGHAGNALNEIADRLAVAARRNAEADVAADVRRRVTRGIVADLGAAA